MTGQQVAKLRDTAVETYMSTTELSEEKTISETLVTGGEEVLSSESFTSQCQLTRQPCWARLSQPGVAAD